MSPCIPYLGNKKRGVAVPVACCARAGQGERAPRARAALNKMRAAAGGARRYTHAQIMLRAREFICSHLASHNTKRAHRTPVSASGESEDSPQTPLYMPVRTVLRV